ncbi:MAG: hypothetical protein OXG52_07640 [bacterium]|nr:hypothetical protein [bacterium]
MKRATVTAKPSPRGKGDPRLNDEQMAQLSAIGGSDALQEALDEVGRQHPELSNE